MLRRGNNIPTWGIDHNYPMLSGSIDIDIINSYAGSGYDFKVFGGGEDDRGDFGLGTNYEGIVEWNLGDEIGCGEAFWLVDFEVRAQEGKAVW